MQTFLPYKHFIWCAKVLDRQRLGKQRVENMQIMRALVEGRGWINHPATKMWRGYESQLMTYQYAICEEWMRRGYKDTCLEKTLIIFQSLPRNRRQPVEPHWLGKKVLHSSHRANLLRKDPVWYGQWGWPEKAATEPVYYWPKPLEG